MKHLSNARKRKKGHTSFEFLIKLDIQAGYCFILLVVASERGEVQTNFACLRLANDSNIDSYRELKLTGVARIRVTTIIS